MNPELPQQPPNRVEHCLTMLEEIAAQQRANGDLKDAAKTYTMLYSLQQDADRITNGT
jgi:hypothetical protein